jgi:hypothetical protein
VTVKDTTINHQQDFNFDNYNGSILITPIDTKNNFICSLKLESDLKNETVFSTNTRLSIIKYSSHPEHKNGHFNNNRMIAYEIAPKVDSINGNINFNYKLSDMGKYKISIIFNEIEGKELSEKVHISFDQIVQ